MLITTALLLSPLATPLPSPLEPIQARARSAHGESEQMLSWSFVEVHYLLRDVDAIDDDLVGLGGRGAYQFDQGFFVRGGIDFYDDDEELTRYDIGIGQSVPLENGLDVYASVSWVWLELDGGGGQDFDENGWRADVGFRTALNASLETEVRLGWEDVADDGLIWGGDLRYWFLPQVALGLSYEREVDDGVWTLGLRYAF